MKHVRLNSRSEPLNQVVTDENIYAIKTNVKLNLSSKNTISDAMQNSLIYIITSWTINHLKHPSFVHDLSS